MDIFDGRVKKWTLDSEHSSNIHNRFEIYKSIKDLYISKFLDCKINIENRIGMESTMGEVFKTNINSIISDKNYYDKSLHFLAAKILPIIRDESYENNEKEIRFAVEASELVLRGESVYFPLVYGFSLCKETYFYGVAPNEIKFHLRFYEKSLRYQKFKFLMDSIESKDFLLNKIVKYKKNFLEPEKVNEILKLNLILPDKVQSHILFSELASFDLNYYLDFPNLNSEIEILKSPKSLYFLLKDVFIAISDLQIKLNILHNDLHLGNILLICDEDSEYEYKILIHDFGKSRRLRFNGENLDHYDKEHDLFFFISKFEEKLRESEFSKLEFRKSKIREFSKSEDNFSIFFKSFDIIADVLYSSKKKYPILDVIEYWESIENYF